MDKIREKIAKLLKMTTANGCSEDEQETAMSMAAALAARSGIELDEVRRASGEKAPRKAIRKDYRSEWKLHQVFAFEAAARLYGCTLYAYNRGKGGLLFVGREENIELAEATAMWLMRQVELLYKDNLPRGLSVSARAQYRRTFKAACALRVKNRAFDLMAKMEAEGVKSGGDGTSLVVRGYFEQLRAENAAFWNLTPEQEEKQRLWREEAEKREAARRAAMTEAERRAEDHEKAKAQREEEKRAARRKGPRPRKVPVGSGTTAGLAAGDRVQLRKEVS